MNCFIFELIELDFNSTLCPSDGAGVIHLAFATSKRSYVEPVKMCAVSPYLRYS